jgi:hypothetical protein
LAVKLTDEQLRDYSRGISAHPAGAAMMADELIALRELLATPTDPAGMEQPEIVPIVDGTHAVAWGIDLEDYGDMQPLEAIGVGAALIRAALEARERTALQAKEGA